MRAWRLVKPSALRTNGTYGTYMTYASGLIGPIGPICPIRAVPTRYDQTRRALSTGIASARAICYMKPGQNYADVRIPL
jgi:hypothetical protein